MGKISLIIKREYLTRVKKKSFIIMTFLGPILFGVFYMSAIFIGMSDSTEHKVMILDHDGLISRYDASLEATVPKYPRKFADREDLKYYFSSDSSFKSKFEDSNYTLMLEFDGESINDGNVMMFYKDLPSRMVVESIENSVENSLEQHRVLDSLHVSFEDYKRMKLELTIREIDITRIDEGDSNKAKKAVVGMGFAFIIYIFIFLYGVQVMRGVIEEKTNRIVEVIISSVKPFELMMGKVIGIGMVGLTQFLLWMILCFVVTSVGSVFLGASGEVTAAVVNGGQMTESLDQMNTLQAGMGELAFLLDIPWTTVLLSFLFYFTGGYLLYGALFAAIGSAVDSETDTQQFMLPVAMPLVFGLMISAFLMANPEGTAGTVFSLVPFTSPVVMMVKVSMGESGWMLALSMLILVVSFLGTIWIAGKIYRTGILMYGKKVSYRELWKWIRYKN